MQNDIDRYEIRYADRLWMLMPEVYRASDSDDPDLKGPLRELCERIGAQMAIVRRSIDRMWEDQSIEGCDDWVVSYIGQLLSTNLVSGLDARGRRLEVANTIFYRRRKGTLQVLEEIARDVTGWDARVVEFFRRMARTRHGLDPEIGLPAASGDPIGARTLQLASGLIGPRSGTPIGGTANLRDPYAGSLTNTAFDEYFHTADVRRGAGNVGWYDIPRLGVFLWRLYSFPQTADDPNDLLAMPVAGLGPRKDCFTFDPTGREAPLFVSGARTSDLSPHEFELPGPIAQALLDDDRRGGKEHPDLYASGAPGAVELRSVGVFMTDVDDPVKLEDVEIWPELGRFSIPADPELRVWYHHGFASRIGAAGYDRRPLGDPVTAPGSDTEVRDASPVVSIGATSTTTFTDSLTYTDVPDVPSVVDVTIRSKNGRRPVIRAAAARPPWTFTSGDANAKLRLEGVFLSGTDIVLSGAFDEVVIRFSTLDPGTAGPSGSGKRWASSIDERELRGTTLWIEGTVRALTIDRSITGPIRTRHDGSIGQLTIRDSIVQLIPPVASKDLAVVDVKDMEGFARALKPQGGKPLDAIAATVRAALSPGTRSQLNLVKEGARVPDALAQQIVTEINTGLAGALFPPGARRSIIPASHALSQPATLRNRAFLADSFPMELGDFAIAVDTGVVTFERVTLLGPAYAHRIDVSESILDDVVWIENPQLGCVRFSAWSSGSILPRKYESVAIEPVAELFTSRAFGQPGYVQLASDVSSTIAEGAENGSEMGAFCSEMAAIKERSLLIKFEEFMPVGLVPVIVHVT